MPSSMASSALSCSSLHKTPQISSIITSTSLQFFSFKSCKKPISQFNQKKNTIITLTAITCFKSGRRTCAAVPASNSNSNSRLAVTTTTSAPLLLGQSNDESHWIVEVKAPPSQEDVSSREGVIDYYVEIMETVLGSGKEAQGCIYNASCDPPFRFCCDVDKETSEKLAFLPEVLSITPDPDFNSVEKDYINPKVESGSYNSTFPPLLFPDKSSKHWLVSVEMPESSVITRSQLVDYYTDMLTKVLENEKDAQMCMYHVSLQSRYGFCCELDDECAKELAGVPGVTSVRMDENVDSDDKDYGGVSSVANQPTNIKTKKLFVTGLSFYTSEKTLRAAFEGFGELVEVKIIMDKISKRSKGFAFIEYTTEEAASAALREMNGKIINGWMIVVDVAKPTPPRINRGGPRPTR